ncbi:MAG TPA: hypothetical protein VGM14_19400, partial [Streptosporangiaceae bacterium]
PRVSNRDDHVVVVSRIQHYRQLLPPMTAQAAPQISPACTAFNSNQAKPRRQATYARQNEPASSP